MGPSWAGSDQRTRSEAGEQEPEASSEEGLDGTGPVRVVLAIFVIHGSEETRSSYIVPLQHVLASVKISWGAKAANRDGGVEIKLLLL